MVTEYAIKRLRAGEAVSFGSTNLPHEIGITDSGEIYLSTDWNVVIIPHKVAEYIAAIVKEGLLDEAD